MSHSNNYILPFCCHCTRSPSPATAASPSHRSNDDYDYITMSNTPGPESNKDYERLNDYMIPAPAERGTSSTSLYSTIRDVTDEVPNAV